MKKRLASTGAVVLSLALLSAALPAALHAYTVYPARHLFDIEKDFLQPSDIAIGLDRRIYVLDGVNDCVKVFDDRGATCLPSVQAVQGRASSEARSVWPLIQKDKSMLQIHKITASRYSLPRAPGSGPWT